METLENIKNRRSVRDYTDEPVRDEDLEKVIEAAMYAPSSGNSQGWEFIVVTDPAKKEEITNLTEKNRRSMNAPVCVIVCYDLRRQKFSDRWPVDCAAAAQNMMLAANDLGLGALWVEIYPDKFRCEGTRMSFGLPEYIMPFCVVCLGYPKNSAEHTVRFEKSKIHRNFWTEG